MWFTWRNLGTVGLEQKVDHAFEMAREFARLLASNEFPNFRLVLTDPQFTNVCFYFLPDALMHQFDDPAVFELVGGRLFHPKNPDHMVGDVTAAVRAEMLKRGQMLMGYASIKTSGVSLPNFFRFISIQRSLRKEHLVFALNHLREIGNSIEIGKK